MEHNVIIAERREGKNGLKASGINFLIALTFFVTDLIFYLLRSSNNTLKTVNKVIFIISCVYLGIATLGILFSYSSFRTNKKIRNTPLLSFDSSDNTFVFFDMYEKKEKKFEKEIVLRVNVNQENDETRIVYMDKKKDKEKEIFIGFANKASEDNINDKINEYKNS